MTHHISFAILPVLTLPGRIDWTIRFSEIIFDKPPYLVLQAIPDFPVGNDHLAERGIVWDVFSLIDSIKRPGAYQVLTCDCGYAPDAGLEEPVLVSHPDASTVVWELDIFGLRPALDDALAVTGAGFVQLVFARDQYEADIRALLRALLRAAQAPVATKTLDSQVYGLEYLLANYPTYDSLCIEMLEPDTQGLALERLLELDASELWQRTPMWPAGTLIEFGFFSHGDEHELIRVNGKLSGQLWPEWYFTRWEVLAAFKNWLSHTQRAFALKSVTSLSTEIGRNEFVLLRESDRQRCHEAGKLFAATVQASLQEGETAPGVTVRYCESPLYAAEAGSFLAGSEEHG
ncbi:hypothetical protein SAMN05421755_11049 [Nitrosomonas sp. Nm33]|nr:hypothetical protein SAMN05421755_11049 [Nitrosomonas sp. Nm33]